MPEVSEYEAAMRRAEGRSMDDWLEHRQVRYRVIITSTQLYSRLEQERLNATQF